MSTDSLPLSDDATLSDVVDAVERRLDAINVPPDEIRERIREQVRFGAALAFHRGAEDWINLVNTAITRLGNADDTTDLDALATEIERDLSQIGDVARSYTVHYVGHAHTDMNWLWDYPETAHTTYRTFSTMLDIMDEYPSFTFTQSQAATYRMIADHAPELLDEIREKAAAGQWEISANTWVQADKNLPGGESHVRQLLYADQFVSETFDTPSASVDLEPDTFGHPRTVPKILSDAGIEYYYLGRAGGDKQPDSEHGLYGTVPELFRWESPDGSSVVAFNGEKLWYNDHVDPSEATAVLDFEAETDRSEYLALYGVGDHGGGPTRADVETIERMDDWPIFPKTKHSTLQAYFDSLDTTDLPVVTDELNYVFRGCYSAQTRVKQYNRALEATLPTAEFLSAVADAVADFRYPAENLRDAWRNVLFNQFHDILPGVGISETYDHALGQYQEAEATAIIARDRAIDSLIDAGRIHHEDTQPSVYDTDGVPLLVFNPTARPRDGHFRTIIYDYPERWNLDNLVAVAPDGTERPVQVLETKAEVTRKTETGAYSHHNLPEPSRLLHDSSFGHDFARIAVSVCDLPAGGYDRFLLRERTGEQASGNTVTRDNGTITVESRRYRVTVDTRRGGITSLYDTQQDVELVPDGERMGTLSVEREDTNDWNSGWVREQILRETTLTDGWSATVTEDGPVHTTVQWEREFRDSTFQMELTVPYDGAALDLSVTVDWHETGDSDTGVPTLRAHFPVDVTDPAFRYDVPYGYEQRPPDGKDVPANQWADVIAEDDTAGMTITNDTTHAYSAAENTLSLTLLRGSYSPDPLPEIGERTINLTLRPHDDGWDIVDAARYGREAAVDPVVQQLVPEDSPSSIPDRRQFLSVDTDGVIVSSVKRAVDGDGVVVRLFETGGKRREVALDVAWPVESAFATDLLEDPKSTDDFTVADGRVRVPIDPWELRTVRLVAGSDPTSST